MAKRTLPHLNATAPLLQHQSACFAALPSYRAINNRDWFCDLLFRASRPQNCLSCEHVSFLIRIFVRFVERILLYLIRRVWFAKNDEVSFDEIRLNRVNSFYDFINNGTWNAVVQSIYLLTRRVAVYIIYHILRFSASFKTILLIIFMNQVWKSYFVESRFIQIMFQCRQFTTKIILFFLHLHTSISDINRSFPIFNIIPRKLHYSFNQVFASNRFVGKIVESAKHKKKGEREIHSLIDRGIPSGRDDTPIKQLASHRTVSRDHPSARINLHSASTLCVHS